MHSTSLTPTMRVNARDSRRYVARDCLDSRSDSWPTLDRRAMAGLIERCADAQLAKILAPKRRSERKCSECNMIMGRSAECLCA